MRSGGEGGGRMILQALAFYGFAGLCLAAAFGVIAARNPVRSVLFLILSFVSAAGLFILLGAEFLGLILIVVYVGAVAVLFLFVVMMLDVDLAEMRSGMLNYLPIGAGIGVLLLAELFLVFAVSGDFGFAALPAARPVPPVGEVSNTVALGRVLYTEYAHFFQIAGLVLLVAMVAAIVLTLGGSGRDGGGGERGVPRKGLPVGEQLSRSVSSSMETRDVEPRRGA